MHSVLGGSTSAASVDATMSDIQAFMMKQIQMEAPAVGAVPVPEQLAAGTEQRSHSKRSVAGSIGSRGSLGSQDFGASASSSADATLWPGETMVQISMAEQLADLLGMIAAHRNSESQGLGEEKWRLLLMVLLVRLKVKRESSSLREMLPMRILMLIWKVMLKALPPLESANLGRMKTEEAIVKRTANLQQHIERVCSLMKIQEPGEVTYPSNFIERLSRAYINHTFECAKAGVKTVS
eukprot:gb/GFBE01060061.1/.p1 GENE.gb/GFBE01060061.1/~~gb/GFBE01060061.1/.p1  ORF type:complete len:238 (+),score=44.14 gb/GFBE01060061.1/:1-714(+)